MLQLPDLLTLWHLPLGAEIAALALLMAYLVGQGAKHGYHYAKTDLLSRTAHVLTGCTFGGDGDLPWARRKAARNQTKRQRWMLSNLELHFTDRRLEGTLYVLLAVMGCDLVRILCAQTLARPVFQGLINWGAGLPFVNPDESGSYGVRRGGEWYRIRKFPGTGYWRLVKAALGALGLFYEPVLRFLWNLISLF